jgi:hypothetical protein
MALQFTRFSLTFLDALGTEVASTYYGQVNDTGTVAQLIEDWQDLAETVEATSSAQLTAGKITLIPALPGGIKVAPTSDSRLPQLGILGFGIAGSSYRYNAQIPSISSSLIGHDDKIVISSGPVNTLITFLLGAATLTTWCTEHAQGLLALKDAVIAFRKRGK